MATQIVTAGARGDGAAAGAAMAAQLGEKLAGATPDLVVAFASTAQDLRAVAGALCDAFPDAVVLTSSTAGEFHEGGDFKGEAVAWALASDSLRVAAGVSAGLKADPDKAVQAALPAWTEDPEFPHQTAIMLLDPLSGAGEEATLLASAHLGPTVRLAGGAAGDDLKFAETLVGAGRAVGPDQVVIARIASKVPLGIGVEHGHVPISPPVTVTKAAGNVVHEFDGKPALAVWKDAVRDSLKEVGVDVDAIPAADLGPRLLQFEVGLIVGANEFKIRAPLAVADDGSSLNFACGLPEGSVVRFMKGEGDAQVCSARGAATRAKEALAGRPIAGALIFDCICRNLVLGDRFKDAVREMHAVLDGKPLAGFETYGEIAMELGQTSGFHNTTTVVLAFPDA